MTAKQYALRKLWHAMLYLEKYDPRVYEAGAYNVLLRAEFAIYRAYGNPDS